MGAPVLPYFGDQFLGIKPPTPVTRVVSVNGNLPCADSYDGSYFTTDGTSISRYNKSQTLVWSLTADNVVTGYTSILGFYFSRSDTTYYAVAYKSATNAAQLFKLTSPATNNARTLVGSAFSTTDNYSFANPYLTVMWRQADDNFRLRHATLNGFISDTVISPLGAKISESRVSQNGIVLQNKVSSVTYETSDGIINFGGITTTTYGITYGVIIKRGTQLLVPIKWLSANVTTVNQTITCRLWDDYVFFGQSSPVAEQLGFTGTTRASLDQWLADVCSAMGI